MKKYVLILAAIMLVGCAQQPVIKTEIVDVERPVAFVPIPPTVPAFESEVDKLTDADINDPGKIGVAYKYDMTMLRGLVKIYEGILQQYRQSSVDFDRINAEIKAMVDQINAKAKEQADARATAAPTR